MRDKPYCKAPWIGLAYEGTVGVSPCCEWRDEVFVGTYTDYLKSDYLKDFKKMMYEDEMNEGCAECIHNERRNESIKDGANWSRRHWFEKFDIDGGLVRLDYRAGNKCNMKCRMCWAGSSSLWEEENIEFYGINNPDRVKLPSIDTSDVYDIDLNSVSLISILGGEPSIDMKVRNFIDYVTKLKLTNDTVIAVTTNGTNASSKWFKTLKAVDNLKIMLSIDGTGNVQDYQRKGGEWNKIKKNLVKYRDTFKDVRIHLTASAINFTVLDLWWDELVGLNIPIDFVVVHEPQSHSLDAIPDLYKSKQIKWLQQWHQKMVWQGSDYGGMMKEAIAILTASKYNEKYHTKFKKETLRLDAIRNESILDLDPRFEEIMNER
jgi:sulfatase maturation enzyme AslB (radical SAM superfamily)